MVQTVNTIHMTHFPSLREPRRGKVRDIYEIEEVLIFVATDRISAFDHVFTECIPDKGKILTSLSRYWLEATNTLVPNHYFKQIDPNILLVKKCRPLPLEMIVRGSLVGSLWRDYEAGKREKCGVSIPEGLERYAELPEPILTPTTKSSHAHDEDISVAALIQSHKISQEQWDTLATYSLKLFWEGKRLLHEKGITLLDAKYEFGIDDNGEILLIDEVHTPDSSRFFFHGQTQSYDKEFLRQWLIAHGFQGEGTPPLLSEELIETVRKGYLHLYRAITGETLKQEIENPQERMVNHLKSVGLIT